MIADHLPHPSTASHPAAGPVVYFVTNDHASPQGLPQVLKIGTTVDLPNRMARMQRRRPGFRARLVAWRPGGEREEAALHLRYRDSRVGAAGDWFWVTGQLLDDLTAATEA